MRAHFDADLIAELKRKVVAHNEAHPSAAVKLGDLRKVYERGFRRSNPGQRAMDRVTEHLQQLAKADDFDESEHPRAKGGEFATKAGAAIASPEAAHRAMQAANPTYRAMTSDVIPEQRNAAIGGAARDVGSLAAGAGLVAALAHSKKGGMLERAGGAVLGTLGGVAAGSGAAVGTGLTRAASAVAHKRVAFIPEMSAGRANAIRRASAKAGQRVGDTVGRIGVRGAATLVQGALKTVGNGPMSARAESRFEAVRARSIARGAHPDHAFEQATKAALRADRRIKFGRKAMLFSALAGTAGLAIRGQIKDSILDPASVGHAVDAFSYRTVQKMAGSDELEHVRKHLVGALAKDMGHAGSMDRLSAWLADGGGDALAKASFQRFGNSFIHLASGLAGAAGAAVGGGLAFGAGRALGVNGKKGNPYRDAHGKFTSRDQAVTGVGSLLGGAAAGLAVYAALKGRNKRIFDARYANIEARALRRGSKIVAGKSARVRDLLVRRSTHVAEIMESHPDPKLRALRTKMKEIREHRASAVAPLQDKLTQVYHQNIASRLAPLADQVTLSNGEMLADRLPGASSTVLANRAAMIRKLLGKAKDEDVQALVAQFPKAERDKIVQTFRRGRADVAAVPRKIADHQGAIEAAENTVAKARKKAETAETEFQAAKISDHLAEGEEQKTAARATLEAAQKALTTTDKALDAASTRVAKLKASPVGVDDPFTGKPITPPSEQEIHDSIEALTQQARERAQGLFDEKVARQKVDDINQLGDRITRLKAAHAANSLRYGVPGAGRRSKSLARSGGPVKSLADAGARLEAAEAELAQAHVAHAPNQRDLADLNTARAAKSAPKDKAKLARHNDVLARAPAIEAAHAATEQALEAAGTQHALRTRRLHQHIEVLEAAMRTQQPEPKAPRGAFLSEQLRGDLAHASATVSGPVGRLLRSPTAARLKALAGQVVPVAKTKADEVKAAATAAGRAVYNEAFTKPALDGKGRDFSLRATGRTALLLAAGAGPAAAYYEHARQLASKDKEKRKAAWQKLKAGAIKVDHTEDPITGAGFTAFSVAHPKIKGERMLVWGEGQLGDQTLPFELRRGATMSDVATKMKVSIDQYNQRRQGGGGAGGGGNGGGGGGENAELKLPDAQAKDVDAAHDALGKANKFRTIKTVDTLPALKVRADDDQTAQAAAGHVIGGLRTVIGGGNAKGQDLHNALGALFSKRAQVLQGKQAYKFLTGHAADGKVDERYKPILGNAGAFASQAGGEVATALSGQVDHIVEHSKPTTILAKANLHRMVALVGDVKGLSAEQLRPIHDKVAAVTVQQPQSPGAPQQVRPAAAAPASQGRSLAVVPQIDLSGTVDSDSRAAWERNSAAHAAMATPIAATIAARLGRERPQDVEGFGKIVEGIARNLHTNHDLTPADSFTVVKQAFNRSLVHFDRDRADAHEELFSDSGGGPMSNRVFLQELAAGVTAHKSKVAAPVEKAILLDDLDLLLKASFGEFEASLHPRAPAGSDAGGEFVAGSAGGAHGSAGGRMAAETAEAGSKKVEHREEPRVASRGQAWAHPVRLGNEAGGALGYETAFNLAQQFLPAGFRGVTRFATEIGAGMAGSYAGSMAGDAAGQAVLRHQGKRAVAYNPPPDRGLGETAASMIGSTGLSLAGQTAGGVVGGALGSVAGPAGTVAGAFAGRLVGGGLGGYVGDLVSRGIYGHLADIDQGKTDKGLAIGAGAAAAGYGAVKAARAGGLGRHFAGFDSVAANRALARFTKGVRL